MSEIGERYRKVAGQFTQRVRSVPATAWDKPAPCDGWVARDVVRHLVEWVPGFFKGTLDPAKLKLPVSVAGVGLVPGYSAKTPWRSNATASAICASATARPSALLS